MILGNSILYLLQGDLTLPIVKMESPKRRPSRFKEANYMGFCIGLGSADGFRGSSKACCAQQELTILFLGV